MFGCWWFRVTGSPAAELAPKKTSDEYQAVADVFWETHAVLLCLQLSLPPRPPSPSSRSHNRSDNASTGFPFIVGHICFVLYKIA